MPTDEVIENKDEFEENTPVTGDGTDDQITDDKGSPDESEQESEQTGSDDGDASPAPSPDPLPDTDGDEPSEAPTASEQDSDSDADADSTDSHGDGESGDDAVDPAEAAQADGDTDDENDADNGTTDGVASGSDADTETDDETAEGNEPEPDAVANGNDDAESCGEPVGDSDTDTDNEVDTDTGDDTDTDTDTDADTETDDGVTADSETIDDVVTDSDTYVTVPIDLPNIDENSEKPVSLRDGIHSEDDDTDRKSRVPRAVKVAAGTIATVAVAAALVTSAVAVMVVEIHPSVIGGETIASQQAGGIDGSGKKISASYTVGDALNSSNSDDSEILSWTNRWYTVAPEAKSVRAEIESAGKGSRIDLSDGTSIDIDGRYASRAGNFDAGIDIEGIAKLYGGDDGWVAIRYDASHVLVGKRVAGGESEGE